MLPTQWPMPPRHGRHPDRHDANRSPTRAFTTVVEAETRWDTPFEEVWITRSSGDRRLWSLSRPQPGPGGGAGGDVVVHRPAHCSAHPGGVGEAGVVAG